LKTSRILSIIALAASVVMFASPAGAVTNGRPDNGRHPYVGLAVFDAPNPETGKVEPAWRCSGTLLSSTVFLTAGHCTDGAVAVRVWFDENVQTNPEYPLGGATSTEGVPYTYPEFCIGCSGGLPGFDRGDVGVVVLTETPPVAQYGSLPPEGLVDTLTRGAPVDIVGYGVQTQLRGGGQPVWTGQRIRLWAPARLVAINFVHSDEFIRLSANPALGKGGTCFGDSGGPDLNGGTDTVLAVNSYVTNNNCTGVTYSQRVDLPDILSWIEGFLS
jgi:hypothetical protein